MLCGGEPRQDGAVHAFGAKDIASADKRFKRGSVKPAAYLRSTHGVVSALGTSELPGWSVRLTVLESLTPAVVLISAEDNLIKGASGAAVQTFNRMFGFEETLGLL